MSEKSMSGRVCLITGASSGVGLMTALGLAQNGAHVFLACRCAEKARQAVDFIQQKSSNSQVAYLPLDLASPKSVQTCVDLFEQQKLPLHVLVNNAGIFFGPSLTQGGINRIFAVNYLGHFLLTNLLLKQLQTSDSARIVLVASDAVYRIKSINWQLVFTAISKQPLINSFATTLEVYSLSKLCLLLMMKELVDRLQGQEMTVNAVHPGFVQSNISLFHRCSKWLGIGVSPAEGAKSSLFCATAPELHGISGQFWGSSCQGMELPALARDQQLAREVWEKSLSLVKDVIL